MRFRRFYGETMTDYELRRLNIITPQLIDFAKERFSVLTSTPQQTAA